MLCVKAKGSERRPGKRARAKIRPSDASVAARVAGRGPSAQLAALRGTPANCRERSVEAADWGGGMAIAHPVDRAGPAASRQSVVALAFGAARAIGLTGSL